MFLNVSVTDRMTQLFSLLRESLKDEERDYTQGSLKRAMVLLAVPMVLEMSMEAVFALVDIFFVSFLGAAAISVVGITEAMLTILYAVALGLSMATTAMIARRIGESDKEGAAISAGQALWLGAFLAAAIGLIGGIYAPTLLKFMGAGPDVIEIGSSYTMIMLAGSASIFYLFLLNAIFRGAGDAAIAMRSLWLANGINIILDPCLIFGLGPFPEMGVTGAAVATTIGRSCGIAYQVWHLVSGRSRIHLAARHLRLHLAVMVTLARVSLGGVMQFLIVTSSWVIVIRVVASYGTAAVAGFTIALRLMEVVFLPAWGLGNAAATLVGQNLGAKRVERARQSARLATRANVAFMFLVATVFSFAPEILLRPFGDDATVLAVATLCLQVIGIGLPVFAIGLVLTQALNGAGDTDSPMWINLVAFWLIQIPLAYWLANDVGLGAGGVAWAIVISESIMSVMALAVFYRGRWATTAV